MSKLTITGPTTFKLGRTAFIVRPTLPVSRGGCAVCTLASTEADPFVGVEAADFFDSIHASHLPTIVDDETGQCLDETCGRDDDGDCVHDLARPAADRKRAHKIASARHTDVYGICESM